MSHDNVVVVRDASEAWNAEGMEGFTGLHDAEAVGLREWLPVTTAPARAGGHRRLEK
jgi:hypothetical protein